MRSDLLFACCQRPASIVQLSLLDDPCQPQLFMARSLQAANLSASSLWLASAGSAKRLQFMRNHQKSRCCCCFCCSTCGLLQLQCLYLVLVFVHFSVPVHCVHGDVDRHPAVDRDVDLVVLKNKRRHRNQQKSIEPLRNQWKSIEITKLQKSRLRKCRFFSRGTQQASTPPRDTLERLGKST